jgi:hypothetical protein
MKLTISVALLTGLLSLSGSAQARSIRFSGEVSKGEEFRKALAGGLIFVLSPTGIVPGAIGGWTIEVSPQGDHPKGCDDFVWVATPPYRFYNARYLDTSYGMTAQDAVKFTPRDFRFVVSCADYSRELEWVDRLLWSYSYSDAQVKEAENKLGSSRHGKGRLWIRSYKISPAPQNVGKTNLGQIDWIKFEVEIQIPGP